MKTRKWPLLCMAILTVLCMSSCEDWGQMDPAAGNQVYPKLEKIASYAFESEDELDPTVMQLIAYPGRDTPTIQDDDDRGNVLYSNGGYARVFNPLNSVKVQDGVSLTFWVKQEIDEEEQAQDLNGALFSFQNENGTQRMFFTANGWLSYDGVDGTFEDNNPTSTKTGMMGAEEWHFVAIAVTNTGYFVYVDGLKKIEYTSTNFDFSKIVQFMASVPYLYIGYGSDSQTHNISVDDFTIYRNTITSKEWSPTVVGPGDETLVPVPDPVYFNNFERGLDGSTIVGSGSLQNIGGNYGSVFQNVGGAQRTNYLLLPQDVLTHSSSTKELTISVWVNSTNAGASGDYMWAPLFMAYGAEPSGNANSAPVLACQYRGILAVNTNGSDNAGDNWCDYTDAQNDAGSNKLYHNDTDWLADKEWHLYTAVFTETTAAVYLDGELANSWTITGSGAGNTVGTLFSGTDLKYVCLGGNQAWNWGDNDPGFMFDDLAIYNKALSADQVKTIVKSKTVPTPIYLNNFERGLGESTIQGSGKLDVAGGNFGNVFQNVGGAQRTNYLLLPQDVLTHSSATRELSIACWVNSTNAGASGDYMWAPLFMAYGAEPSGNANSAPVLACQYRGILAVNTNGSDNAGDNWCDYTDAQNDAGSNKLYHNDTDWLADKEWHLYTAVFTETTAAVYLDGELANSWTITGSGAGNTVGTLFSGTDLKYVCLGGNQAWNWGDNDPGFMFDNVAIYNVALTADQVKTLTQLKK